MQSKRRLFLPNVDMEVASIYTFYNLFSRSEQDVLHLAKIFIMPLLLEKIG